MFRKLLLALAAVCLMTGSAVAADAFPNRPITIVVPFAAGGETDLVARMLADGMSKELKQVMVVQNIVGASGVAGISAVTGAKPDGYLGVTSSAPLCTPHAQSSVYAGFVRLRGPYPQGSVHRHGRQDRALEHA
ncbi:MAG: Bug family tripartite tricarboxylate transporter substrate binding protein [Bilophila wadsworthia]